MKGPIHLDQIKKILVSRPDRIGDVVLSLPVLENLKRKNPKIFIGFLVQEKVAPLVSGLPFVDQVHVYDPQKSHRGVFGKKRLIREIKKQAYQVSLSLFSDFQVDWVLKKSNIPFRVGPKSKWFTYFFYHRGVRQRRSQVRKHERDYNLDLLKVLGVEPDPCVPQVFVSEDGKQTAQQWLKTQKIESGFILIHPGMGGSALNWPLKHYLELVRKLLIREESVVLSFGPMDQEVLSFFEKEMQTWRRRPPFFISKDKIESFVGLLNEADWVIAPSTGPVHLGAALRKKVVSFYPPLRVQSKKRWGPFLDQGGVLEPTVVCPAKNRCLGVKCTHFPCMNGLEVEAVLNLLDHYEGEKTDAVAVKGSQVSSSLDLG